MLPIFLPSSVTDIHVFGGVAWALPRTDKRRTTAILRLMDDSLW
jgi:hypothetical protein